MTLIYYLDTLQVPEVMSWASLPSYDDESNLQFEDDWYYKERLVPDGDPEDICIIIEYIHNTFLIYY
jgi:hypothetical protein